MTTNNAVNVGLSGSTGTGNFVGATSPTLVTPTLGAATATSLTFSPTTSGIVGTTTNDNAAAGKVGEFVTSNIPNASPVTFSAATPKDLTSISLTAGDWDVWGNIGFSATTVTQATGWLNTASATQPDNSLITNIGGVAAVTNLRITVPYQRFSLSGTTTVYISGECTGTGTFSGVGAIYARRPR